MKKLMILFAAAALITAASTARAHMAGTDAIDSGGVAVVSIQTPAFDTHGASIEKVYLDSNGIWEVNDLRESKFYADQKSGMKERLLCFDSGALFCARSY